MTLEEMANRSAATSRSELRQRTTPYDKALSMPVDYSTPEGQELAKEYLKLSREGWFRNIQKNAHQGARVNPYVGKFVMRPVSIGDDAAGGKQYVPKTWGDWDRIKQMLDDRANHNAAQGSRMIERDYRARVANLLEKIDAVNPAYATARLDAQAEIVGDKAYDLGAKLLSNSTTEKDIGGFLEEARASRVRVSGTGGLLKDYYENRMLAGFAENLQKQLDQVVDPVNASVDLKKMRKLREKLSSKDMRAKLETLGARSSDFEDLLAHSRILLETSRGVGGNSATFSRQINNRILDEAIGASVLRDLRNLRVGDALGKVFDRVTDGALERKKQQALLEIAEAALVDLTPDQLSSLRKSVADARSGKWELRRDVADAVTDAILGGLYIADTRRDEEAVSAGLGREAVRKGRPDGLMGESGASDWQWRDAERGLTALMDYLDDLVRYDLSD